MLTITNFLDSWPLGSRVFFRDWRAFGAIMSTDDAGSKKYSRDQRLPSFCVIYNYAFFQSCLVSSLAVIFVCTQSLVLIMDRQKILENGFFGGYNGWTWATILDQAVGGLIVAMVVK